jgi:UDP-N-acetylglucosamine diphosphorylase/glucosamine-1-phosphate N-acetyltransferase
MSKFPIVFFDDADIRLQLAPFTFTRPIADIRVGISTIREQWEHVWEAKSYTLTQEYLQSKWPMTTAKGPYLFINGACLPDEELIKEIKDASFTEGSAIYRDGILLACISQEPGKDLVPTLSRHLNNSLVILHPWHIFLFNDKAIRNEFKKLTAGRISQPLSSTNLLIGDHQDLFIEEGAVVEGATLNTKSGPIYISAHAEVMEGCTLRGPLAMCEHSTTKMGTKIYGATTLGPHVKVGGEISNSVIFGYSNKGHDGFLGNSVLGEWCNLGADTNNSNLKNNYGEVKVWSYKENKEVNTGLQFCGLFMGDHSKSSINTMFNTGTVVGVSSNIFGGDFPPKHVASFQWGGASGFESYQFEKAMEVAASMMKRREIELSGEDKMMLEVIFQQSKLNQQ